MALHQVFRGETVFYGGFRKLSPKPPEQCYGSSGVLLRLSWSNATAAPEKPYGPSAKRPKGRAAWLEVPYEAVLGWLSVRNTRIYGGERSVDAKYSSIGKGVVKIIRLFFNISPSHPSLSVRRVAALQCGGNLLHHLVFVLLVHLAGKNLYEFIGVVFPYVLHQGHNAVAEHREAAVGIGKLRRQREA